MEREYEDLLKKAGFDDKETKVYLAALELRSAPASIIAQKAGIVRSTCYGILEELVRKGLASKTEKPGGIRIFNVENPELLKNYVDRQKESFDILGKEINKFLPGLKKLQREFSFKPQIEYFEGKNAVESAFETVFPDVKRMAKEKIPLLIHGQTEKVIRTWPQFPAYAARRKKTGIKIKMLIWRPEIDKEMKEIHKGHYQIRKLPDRYGYRAATHFYDEKIILFDFDNNFTVIIQNEPLTQMMRIFFEFMWEHSK
jgi:sugar-specific transcriptional regulator TrmB